MRWTMFQGGVFEEEAELQRVDDTANKSRITYTPVSIDGRHISPVIIGSKRGFSRIFDSLYSAF